MNPFSALGFSLHRWRRERALRRFYSANLRETTGSLADRMAYHIEHIRDYWGRCLGFVDQIQPRLPVRGDLWACVAIGTRGASPDVCEYCTRERAEELRQSWLRYERRVEELARHPSIPPDELESCAAMFDTFRQLYDTSTKVT